MRIPGYVTEAAFSQEREARLLAEKRAAEAEGRLAGLRELIAHLRVSGRELSNLLQEQARRYAESQLALLEHVVPLKPENTFSPDNPELAQMSYDEIMAQPVATRQAMFLRKEAALRARERDMNESERKSAKERREHIVTDEEKRTNMGDFDSTLGIYQEPVAERAESDADAAN